MTCIFCLQVSPYSLIGVQISQLYKVVGILWDVKTLGSHISETIYPILMKFTGCT